MLLGRIIDERRNADVVVDYISFCKLSFRIKDFAQSRAVDVLPFDFERDLISGIGRDCRSFTSCRPL